MNNYRIELDVVKYDNDILYMGETQVVFIVIKDARDSPHSESKS